MVREINSLGTPPTLKETRTERNEQKVAAQAAKTEAEQPSTQADVELSSEAQGLSALADKVANLPDVNLEKVERIKTALENNEFNIDDLVIADKLINNDDLF